MVSANVVLDTPNVLLAWDLDTRSVVLAWKGVYVSGEEYRAILLRTLELMESKRSIRLLADMRNMPVMSPDDQKWVQEVWMPRSVQVGLRYSAIVAPKSAITKLTVRHLIEDGGALPRLRSYFATVEEAKAWLKTVGSN